MRDTRFLTTSERRAGGGEGGRGRRGYIFTGLGINFHGYGSKFPAGVDVIWIYGSMDVRGVVGLSLSTHSSGHTPKVYSIFCTLNKWLNQRGVTHDS